MPTHGSDQAIPRLLATRAIRARYRFAIAPLVTGLPALAGAAVSVRP